ncbi:MAG: hypothetical protein F4169_05210 [Gammaproteobacteria bacterium]|nr:hypothetical protein [Chloroflexota bacterium]MYF28250.1 hypothetical protein [Gammaproteobacteria bacterium]MYK62460.1 hypothetical protein [Chloroflexota bacterium]
MPTTAAPPRPNVLEGVTTRLNTERGELFVTVSTDAYGSPVEVFGRLGKAGSFEHGVTELACRLVTLALRSGATARDVVSECHGISEMQPFPNRIGRDTVMVHGLGDGIAHVLASCVTTGDDVARGAPEIEQVKGGEKR